MTALMWRAFLLVSLAVLSASCGGEPAEETDAAAQTDSGDAGGPTDAAEGADEGAAASGDPIVMGGSVSESGFNAAVSQDYLLGLQIWADMLNNGTGIYADRDDKGFFGRPVELTHSDDESDPENALRIYERLMSRENVDLVFTPYGSGSTGVVAPIIERQGYAMVVGSSSSETVYRQGLEMMVMSPARSSNYLGELPDLIDAHGYTDVAMVTLDNPITNDSAQFLQEQGKQRGWQVTNEPFEIGNEDFTSIWTKVSAQDPDVLILHAFGTDATTAMRQAFELGISPPMAVMFNGAWRDDVFVEGVGADNVECIVGELHWSPAFTYRGSQEFWEAYQDRAPEGRGSDPSAAWGFATGQLLTEAIDAVGEEALTDQALIIDYLKSTETEYLMGPWEVDPETGINISTEPGLEQFQDGERVVIAPEDAAEGEFEPCGAS